MTIEIPDLKTVSLANQRSITFTVLGLPAPGGSKAAVPAKGRRFAHMIPASKRTKPWMALVSAAGYEAHPGPLLAGPIEIVAKFYRPRPKHHYRTGMYEGVLKDNAPAQPLTMPDTTKLWRSTEDALTGILWRDDSQVVKATISKHYGEPARAEIEVTKTNAVRIEVRRA